MPVSKINFRKSSLGAVAALALAATSLAGCVVYPNSYGYYGGGGGYYGGPAYYAPPVGVVIGGGCCWGGGWGGRRWR